jgi:hypothetical protein
VEESLMGEETIVTGVDRLLDYLKGKDRVAMQDVATALGVPSDTLQAWTDFLVEEKILGIEYKFTKPFIYLNVDEKPKKPQILEQTSVSLDDIKKEYMERGRAKKMPESALQDLWLSHVSEALKARKQYFFEQASKRNAANPQKLWEEYQRNLLARC